MTSNTKQEFYLDPSALPSVEEAATYVGEQRTYYKRMLKTTENATIRAAYATFIGEHVLKVIFQPRGTEGAMTGEQWANTFGKPSKSLTTGWKVLGHALMVVGLAPDNQTFVRLQKSNAYALTAVRDAVLKDGATEESIAAALAPYADEFGKRISKPTGARPDDGSGTAVSPTGDEENKGQEQGDAVPVSVQFLAAISLIEKVCGDPAIDLDVWAAGADRLTEAITKGNTLRAHAAATPKATPATVAKGKGRKAS